MTRIGVLNGPKLDRLGRREPEHYGRLTLPRIQEMLERRATDVDARIEFFQSDDEGSLVAWIELQGPELDGLLVNAGRFTHESLPLAEALAASRLPFVEVHLSNVFARERFRRNSLLAEHAIGVIVGFKAASYMLGLDALLGHLATVE